MAQMTWGILLAAYLFVGGMAGGAYIVGALADIFGDSPFFPQKDKWKVLSRSGVYLSLISIILGLVFLVLDLGRFEVNPLSPLNAYIHFPTSIMSLGTWIITAFTLVSMVTAVLWFFRGNSIIRKLIEIVGIILGGSTAAYTGLLLSFARGRPFWNTPFIPWTFIISGALTGLAMSLFLIPIIAVFMPRFFEDFKELVDRREKYAQIIQDSQRYIMTLIVIELVLVVLEMVIGHGAQLLSMAKLSLPFIIYLIAGLLAPLGIAYYCDRAEYVGRYSMLVPASITSSILILIGGFFLRYVMLMAGQIIL